MKCAGCGTEVDECACDMPDMHQGRFPVSTWCKECWSLGVNSVREPDAQS